ncbi:MAG TPA: choice-of-anchor tandem repeat GloVer-containing protein [Candidatus Tumulicola sp.]|nr:choice-of-anchor tandem repeat GloVer-containing protein [Candidatus Tumulicola sp.]
MLHAFGSGSDGFWPEAGLVNVNGIFYGTTAVGGAYVSNGTIFSITPSGTETVQHNFVNSDGGNPHAGLIDVKGTLYGTTQFGGANGAGTVFSLTPSGTQTVLHSFLGNTYDGAEPVAPLTNVAGTLYGTTQSGGAHNDGTVFKITLGGKFQLLYSFGSSLTDASSPQAGLINVNGTLYGTTFGGGSAGDGTVFSITPSGKEVVLHSFDANGSDGTFPDAGLVDVNGTLYGTTQYGGTNSSPSLSNVGTVFSITPRGSEKVLYSFAGGSDGRYPRAGLIDVKGTLYGTTENGGAGGAGCPTGVNQAGCGTVFSITTSGSETVVYSFRGGSDGLYPRAELLDVGKTLYGTTIYGGGQKCSDQHRRVVGCGTVFSLTNI